MELKFEYILRLEDQSSRCLTPSVTQISLADILRLGGDSGPLNEGKSVIWDFADHSRALSTTIVAEICKQRDSSRIKINEYTIYISITSYNISISHAK